MLDDVPVPDGVTLADVLVVTRALPVFEPVIDALEPIESVAVGVTVMVAVTDIVLEVENDILDVGD